MKEHRPTRPLPCVAVYVCVIVCVCVLACVFQCMLAHISDGLYQIVVCSVSDSWYLSVATLLTVITMVGLPLTSTRTQTELNQWELTCNPIYILIPCHRLTP